MNLNERDWRLLQAGVEQVQTGTDHHAVLSNLVRLAVDAAKSRSGSLYLLDKRRQVLKPAVIYGLPEDYVRLCGEVRVGDQCCGRAVASKSPWIVSDMLTDPLFATAREASKKSGIRAAFSVPVIGPDRECLGSLACHYRSPRTPTAYELERNRMFATLIAFALSASRAKKKPSAAGSRAARPSSPAGQASGD